MSLDVEFYGLRDGVKLTKGSPLRLLTPLDIVAIGIVRSLRIRRGGAYKGSSALCTCTFMRFESFTLKMKIKDVEDCDENWHFTNTHKCAKIGASRFSLMFAVHNRIFRGGRTDARTNVHN